MNAGPVDTVRHSERSPHIAGSAVALGVAELGERSLLTAGTEVDGFPATEVGRMSTHAGLPSWALRRDDLPELTNDMPRR